MRAERSFDVCCRHVLVEVEGALRPDRMALRDALDPGDRDRARVAVFIDDGLANAHPALPGDVERYAAAHADRLDLAAPPRLLPGGEGVKNDRAHIDRILEHLERAGLCRQSYVLAIGGGAVLDAVGFAASMAHRGVRLVRMPTTTVGQADSGVGVKNGVNAFGKKNYLGAFGAPWGVINDPTLLTTLSDRDWRCGFAEAVKVALVKDAGFFDDIERAASRIARRDLAAARPIVWRSGVMHLDHIALGGDPFELTTARPLDFGHWAAHRLEQLSGFRLRHGEAVAIGLAIDVVYASLAGWLRRDDADRVLACLEALGFRLTCDELADPAPLLRGLEEFREHLGGRLTVSMLRAIGDGFDVHEIDHARMIDAVARLDERARRRTDRAGARGEEAA